MKQIFAVFICTVLASWILFSSQQSEAGENRIFVTSLQQIDAVVNSTRPGITLVWAPDRFPTPENAQLMLDVLRLTQAWDTWFLTNGDDVTDINARVRFVYVDPTDRFNKRERALLLTDWFRGHLETNETLASHASSFLDFMPAELGFAKRSMKKVFTTMTEHLDALMIAELERDSFSVVAKEKTENGVTSAKTADALATPQRSCEMLFFPAKRAFRVI